MHLAPTNIHLKDITHFVGQILSLPYHDYALIVLTYLIYILAAWIILAVIFRLIIILRHLKEMAVLLEITPPQDTEIASVSTSQLFNLISDLLGQHTFTDYLSLRQISSSFEIVSHKETGIRYIVRLPETLAGTFTKSLRAYIPGIRINETSEYLPPYSKINQFSVTEYKLLRHFSLPIADHKDLKKHDPLAYLTGNMTELKEDDLIVLQMVLHPLNSLDQIFRRQEISKIKSLIRLNRFAEWYSQIAGQATLNLFAGILEGAARILALPLLVAADFVTGHDSKLPEKVKSTVKLTPAMQEQEELIKAKLSQPLFGVSIRALLVMDQKELVERKKGLSSSFSSYRHPQGQSIIASGNILANLFRKISYWFFQSRIGNSSMVLSTSEIAALYHFPYANNPESAELLRVRSRELPAPLSMKKADAKYDVIFGVNKFNGENVPIGLTLSQRQKHMYLIGKTGMGKTTLLKSAIYQDMLSGKGLAVLDPHGDLLQELISIVPENRREDVIVFDPSDREWPIGLNILSPGINFTNKEDQDEWITGSVLAVFAKITAKEYWGPRMEHILRNATLTALQTPNPSLYTLQQLLTDKGYQKKIAGTLKDPVLKQFWNKEFALLGKMQLSSVVAPLTQRLGSFITTKMSRHILLQEKSTISISQIMDQGKILLVNLSKGDLGEDMSFFFGMVLTSFIWMAAYQRTKIPEKERRDFFLYVDEFQNFATPRFSEITSEGRKFHVSLIASHQNIAQVDDQSILKIVAGNANSIVCLKASPDDEKFILPFMEPEVEKGDIVNLAPYHFFMKQTNETSENAFSGITVPLDIQESEEVKDIVKTYSRRQFATPRKEVEEYLDKMFSGRLEEPEKIEKKNTPVKKVARSKEDKPEKEAAETSQKPKTNRMK